MDDNLDDFIEWLRVLKLPEEDFRRHIRGYFDDTREMEEYIETRKPQHIRYAHLEDPSTISMVSVPTKPYQVQEPTEPETPKKAGHYKGKRRKR